ncbi:MAG: DNA-directed RNA polymerase subunit omega [Candidatus Omnitrophota bacterium]|nr:DNA-directed RNA polymerase subunit omega [Candidatus Omnitrophota bacterium]
MYEVDIEKLLNKTGSTYKLVVLTTMRAIELSDGAARLVTAAPEIKTINVALQEISEGKITYKMKEKK